MKAYKSYFDRISLDPVLREQLIRGKKKAMAEIYRPRRSNDYALKFAAIAACTAVVLLVVWLFPAVLDNQTGPEISHHAQVPAIADRENEGLTQEKPDYIPADFELHALTFNTVEAMMSASRAILPDGRFDYDITEEQLNAMFPGFRPTLNVDGGERYFSAAAHYLPDGSLEFVWLGESVITDDMRVLWMNLQIAEGDIPGDIALFYGGEAVISNVHGVSVTAFMHSQWDDVFLRADFTFEDVTYRVTFSGFDLTEGQERLTAAVNQLIAAGPVDLSPLAGPIIPELRNELFTTFDQARQDPDFGRFLPASVPEGFAFYNARRILDTRVNSLTVFYMYDVPWQFRHTISWHVSEPAEHNRIVSVNDRHKYDVSLYPTPWADSVPREYRNYFHNPVFLASEISLDTVRARTRWFDDDRNDFPEWRTLSFGILYENVNIQISANGVSAEELWEIIRGVIE